VDPRFRQLYNSQFTQERYEWYARELARRLGTKFEFRLAETPVFLPDDFKARVVSAAKDIVAQLSVPKTIDEMKRAIPDRWNVPRMDALPNLTQVDFAVVEENGALVPKLIELQGFPSLTALQVIQRDVWNDALQTMRGLDLDWSCWFSGLDRNGFLDFARRTIAGNHDPREVVLLDIDPPAQKTAVDFAATKLLFGVDAVDPRSLVKRGRKLFRDDGTPVKRIYNRVVFDELIRKNIQTPFDYREELDVEWAGHPNWYFRMSKFSLPFLKHESVPKTWFLSDVKELPADRENYVLKPLYSFAGAGIVFGPTDEQINAIPHSQRSLYILQERVTFERTIETPHGPTQPEIRMMYVWLNELKPVMSLIRMGRGKMMGVDHNRELEWVGSSASLIA
jgi:hypothetical protein